jgi:hypothetical protein
VEARRIRFFGGRLGQKELRLFAVFDDIMVVGACGNLVQLEIATFSLHGVPPGI